MHRNVCVKQVSYIMIWNDSVDGIYTIALFLDLPVHKDAILLV